MKHAKTILAGAIAMLAAVAMASVAKAQVSEFGPELNNFLNEHPRLAETVRANPQLLHDKKFRREHPELQQFMQEHPGLYEKNFGPVGYPGGHGPGAYDRNHQWRDVNWWHQNDPDWIRRNHPEWYSAHPEWGKPPRRMIEAHPEAVTAPPPPPPPAGAPAPGQPQKHGHHKGNANPQ